MAGARSAGADDRMLSDSENSICFLTKVEVAGIQSPEDRGSCRIAVADVSAFCDQIAEKGVECELLQRRIEAAVALIEDLDACGGKLLAYAVEVTQIERDVIECRAPGSFGGFPGRKNQKGAGKFHKHQRRISLRLTAEDVHPDRSLPIDVGHHDVMMSHCDTRIVERQNLRASLERKSGGHYGEREDFHDPKAIMARLAAFVKILQDNFSELKADMECQTSEHGTR